MADGKICVFIIGIILAITYFSLGIVLAVYTVEYSDEYEKIENSKDMFKQIVQDQRKPLVQDIAIVHENEQCPQNYNFDMFKYIYHGTVHGCQCNPSYNKGIVREDCCKPGEKDYWTTETEYYTETDSDGNEVQKSREVDVPPDCTCFGTDIYPVGSKLLNNFKLYDSATESMKKARGCAKILDGYTFESKSPKFDSQKQLYCENSSEKVCGGNYNGICYPQNIGCPIFDVEFAYTLPIRFQELGAETKKDYFHFLRMYNDQEPIFSFQASQGDSICQDGSNNYDSGRSSYILETEFRTPCQQINNNYNKKINYNMNELEFFQFNDQSYLNSLRSLPQWEPFSDQYNIDIFQKSVRGIHLNCRHLLDHYDKYDEYVQKYIDEAYSIHVAIGFFVFFTMIQSAVICVLFAIFIANEAFHVVYITGIICLILKQAIMQPIFWTYHSRFHDEGVDLIEFLISAQDPLCPASDKVSGLELQFYEVQYQEERLRDWFLYITLFWPENLLIYITLLGGLGFLIIQFFKCCLEFINNQQIKKANIITQKQIQNQKQQQLEQENIIKQNQIQLNIEQQKQLEDAKHLHQQLQINQQNNIVNQNQNLVFQEEFNQQNKQLPINPMEDSNNNQQDTQKPINPFL